MAPDTATARPWPDAHPVLLPLLPLIHTVWADGMLTDDELRAFRADLEAQEWLPADARAALAGWLDPDDPPSPSELTALGERIRGAVDPDGGDLPGSLTELGLRLGRAEADAALWDAEAEARLRAVEAALGVVGGEAVRAALDLPGPMRREPHPTPAFDPAALRDFLDRDHRALRSELMELLKDERLRIPHGTPSCTVRGGSGVS